MQLPIDPEVEERIARLEIPFNAQGVDPYGVSKKHLGVFLSMLKFLYRTYFSVEARGVERVPKRGRAMLVGNHSGGIAIDGAMVITSMLLEMDPPRLAQGMVEKFMNQTPFMSQWSIRTGQFTGLPEHAVRLLEDDRLLMVFPEGARGINKLFAQRYQLSNFGHGFMRLALETKAPIVPVALVGAEEQAPAVADIQPLARLLGFPSFPVIFPQLLPLPLPVRYRIHFGEPLEFKGSANDDDDVVGGHVKKVKHTIQRMLEKGLERRRSVFF